MLHKISELNTFTLKKQKKQPLFVFVKSKPFCLFYCRITLYIITEPLYIHIYSQIQKPSNK